MSKGRLKELLTFTTTDAGVERALGLPQRTISRIRATGRTSAAMLTLLRCINRYPWLLEVADTGFDEVESRKIMCRKAVDLMLPECP